MTSHPISAVIFPGQGAQRAGMALDFAEQFEVSREVFARASAALSLDLLALCRGDDPRLHHTEFTQPCLLTAELAMFQALVKHFGFAPTLFGGHSLGEYSALVAAGVLPLELGVRLVRRRGQLMQEVMPAGQGGMIALCLKPEEIPRDFVRQVAEGHEVDLANENSPHQIVLSGENERLERAAAELRRCLGERLEVTALEVSGPFHSRHMRPAADRFREILESAREHLSPAAATRVLSNARGGFHGDSASELVGALSLQLSQPIRWMENMRTLVQLTRRIVEVGPHPPLRGFFKVLGVSVSAITHVRHAPRAFPD